MRRSILLILMLTAGLMTGLAVAQDLPPGRGPSAPKDLPLASTLYQAQQLAAARTLSADQLSTELSNRGLRVLDDGLVHVTVMGPEGGTAVPVSLITAVGGRDDVAWRHVRDAWVPVSRLEELARRLPAGYFLADVEEPQLCEVVGEGPAALNSDTYRDGGAAGWGRTVAIIDGGFDGLTEAWNNGDIPSPYNWHNYTPDPLESVTIHGTGCVETVFDHCPDATFHLYMLDSPTDLGPAVDNAIAVGVNVISMSLVWCANAWFDDSGEVASAVTTAANSGIVVSLSAGNYAECHYQGVMSPGGDDWHDFTGDDETINIIIGAGERVNFSMVWNTNGDTYDYDIYLFDASFNEIASSTNPSDYFEQFSYTNTGGSDQLVHLAVESYSGGNTEFEIFTYYGDWQEHQVATSSCPPPNNASAANILTVGAVEWDDFQSPNGTGNIVTGYSSRGPSNNGRVQPDVCGPTRCNTFIYPGGMGGTSNSAPNVAGALCALWSADPVLYADTIRWLAHTKAGIWRDWGSGGLDNVYGHGGMYLWYYHPGTLWISRAAGNTTDHRSYPLYTVQGANDWAVNGGRFVFLGAGSYPEPAVINRAVAVETPVGGVVLGE